MIIILIAGILGKVAEGAPMRLRVMAYNIHHGADPSGRVDLVRTAETILDVAPDILFLSEVDQDWKRSGLVDQPRALSRAAELPFVHFGPALTTRSPLVTTLGRTARYGNAFLSKVPFREAGIVALPRRGTNEPRNVLWIDVETGGHTLRLFGTHLSVDSRERETQLQALGQLIDASPYPAVVVGDFNSPPDRLKKEAPYLWLSPWHDAHAAIGKGEGLTFPAPLPTSRIDYIFLHDELLPRLTRVKTPTSEASDHYPVVVELTFDSHDRTERS